jgi:hypothetical protein
MKATPTKFNPATAGQAMLSFRLLCKLIDKGVLTQAEAADVALAAAADIREATEGEADQFAGDLAAQSHEAMAAWLLGYSTEGTRE